MTAACDLLGHSRQAFYKKKTDEAEQLAREIRILDAVREIREIDPGIGGVKLWLITPSPNDVFTFFETARNEHIPRK